MQQCLSAERAYILDYVDWILDYSFGQDNDIIQAQMQDTIAPEIEYFAILVKGFGPLTSIIEGFIWRAVRFVDMN